MHFYKTALKSNVCQLRPIKTSQSQFFLEAANALGMCKADWSGEAAYRLAGLISNLWQQYVSPCASSRLLMLNTNHGHSIYGNLCLRGEKKLKRWDWHFNLHAPLKICFSLIHYTTANYLSRRYKLDISEKIMRCWGGSWNVLVQRAASMNRGKWSKYGRLGHTMCWMRTSGMRCSGGNGPKLKISPLCLPSPLE